MAQLQNTTVASGCKLNLSCTSVTGSGVGIVRLDSTTCSIIYSYCGGIWSTAANMINGNEAGAAAGTQNEGIFFGGYSPTQTCTEEYNGSSWTIGNTMITARKGLAGAGTQNAALAFGGTTPLISNNTEEYDGTSWIAGGNLIIARYCLNGSGTQNAALSITGFGPSYNPTTCTEEYDGSTWAAGGATIIPRYSAFSSTGGTQNSSIIAAGLDYSSVTATEQYNGNSWSSGARTNAGRQWSSNIGTATCALMSHGFWGTYNTYPTIYSEKYDENVSTVRKCTL